jgi:ribosome maturation factor RimP
MSQHARHLSADRSALDRVIEPIARAHGAEVVDLELKPEHGGWVLRVFVEKLGAADGNLSTQQAAVDLELCTRVARDLSTALDVADVVPHAYNLEVSSPGIERSLRTERDYVRFAGKKAKLRLVNAVRGQKVLVGVLGGVDGGKTRITDGPHTDEIPIADIENGRLVFEFGPAERPSRPGKKQKRKHH